MKKGFISILASLVILAVGFGAAYQYSKNLKDELDENIVLVSQKVDKLGGSLVATRYGGTGTSTNAWSGLLRLTSGVWATTTLADADVPDNITVTGITSLSLNSLISASTTFTGTTTLRTATPTQDYEAAPKVYVDTISSNSFATTTASSTIATAGIGTAYKAMNTYYRNTTGKTLIVVVVARLTSDASSWVYVTASMGTATPTSMIVAQLGTNSNYAREFSAPLVMFVPNNYYYDITKYAGGTGTSTIHSWAEITSN